MLSARRAALLAAVALLGPTGCSFLATAAPPSERCTTSRFPPLLDTTIAALSATAAPYEISRGDVGPSIAAVASAAAFGASAVVGWSRTSRCAAAARRR